MLFKAQLFALTGVQPQSQKVMLKGALLKDDPSGWNLLKPKLKNGVTLLMMGTKDEDALVTVKDSDKTQVYLLVLRRGLVRRSEKTRFGKKGIIQSSLKNNSFH